VGFVVACAQLVSTAGLAQRNVDRMGELAARAARLGARILVFPELCFCGYLSPSDAGMQAVIADGPELEAVRSIARSVGVALCFGFAERAPDGLYNSMALVERDGSLRAVYRKVHLWVTEREWAREGDSLVSFGVSGARCGMWICYDSRFPETAQTLASRGVTLALVGSAWFGPDAEWELALRARALDNGIFAAGAVSLGSFGSAPFHGTSLIVDPHGTVLARAPAGEEAVIAAEYDERVIDSFRARLPLREDRRSEASRVRELP